MLNGHKDISITNKSAAMIVVVLLIAAAMILMPEQAFAQAGDAQAGVDSVRSGSTVTLTGAIGTIVNTFLFLIGAVSVLMIIYGGFRYVSSGGEASAVKSAKDTIMYSIAGLVIALSAYAITNFATSTFDRPEEAESSEQNQPGSGGGGGGAAAE